MWFVGLASVTVLRCPPTPSIPSNHFIDSWQHMNHKVWYRLYVYICLSCSKYYFLPLCATSHVFVYCLCILLTSFYTITYDTLSQGSVHV